MNAKEFKIVDDLMKSLVCNDPNCRLCSRYKKLYGETLIKLKRRDTK